LAGWRELGRVGEWPLFLSRGPAVPFKVNQGRRHHIPRQRRGVTDWPEYAAELRQRGSLIGDYATVRGVHAALAISAVPFAGRNCG
jgi:hypothetical protein